MKKKIAFLPLLFGLFLLAGCPSDGALENAGEEADQAIDDAADAVEDATD